MIIHESGHTFFGILGWRMLTILGGALLEVVLPILILIYFWIHNKKTGSQLPLYMAGFSLLRVGYYASDAEAPQLPLLGGLPKR